MKKLYFLLVALCTFSAGTAQVITFTSLNFKNKVLASDTTNQIAKNLSGTFFKVDANNNGQIEITEALQVSYLDISSSTIHNMEGLQYFTNLLNLYCQNNFTNSNILDVSMLSSLQTLTCNNNNLNTLNVSYLANLREIKCGSNGLTSLDVSSLSNLEILRCDNSALTTLNLSGLTNLNELHCFGSSNLASINFTGCSALNKIVANNCGGLNGLNLAGLTSLSYLECSQNNFTILNASNLPNLTYIQAAGGQLTSVDVSNSTNLYTLLCNNSQLTNVNLHNCSQLYRLNLGFNQLTTLNLEDCFNLYELDCKFNLLTTLDVSNCGNLTTVYCSNNNLISMFLKNNHFQTEFGFSNNNNLSYICCDDDVSLGMTPGYGEQYYIQNKLTQYGMTGCTVNPYCSFVPGGTYYTVQGNSRFDSNGNGCDGSDIIIPAQRYSTNIGGMQGSLITNTSGNYFIPVPAGTHTITPIFENPSYFAVSPPNTVVNFPTQTSPFTQNFCVTANGVHPDLEVILLPLIPARPGFDAKYKIIYKNKGNTTQSGLVNLTFNDAVLDFVAANPATSSQATNILSWNFTNLLPFETREIALTLNVNSPTETPEVNSGYILNYNATITSAATDDTPNDNTLAYNQTVVNSFDPNDKTCLEGATITPAKVGDYVHYMIRFENNGTANAQNIVVKDMIDTAKFDINTLTPIKGSHSFVTNITSGNKVEFIFQNINLPFDNANNDGYVAFKIKTKATLVVGNTFTNNASIYFDYNFPIVTNTATTTIAVLATQDFAFSNYFSVYPNPVKDILNIAPKETIEVISINIYNTLGQLVLVISNAQNTSSVDVSGLTSGNYFIKINSDKGTSNTKFIKN